jgi:Tol biopolymer transport system component
MSCNSAVGRLASLSFSLFALAGCPASEHSPIDTGPAPVADMKSAPLFDLAGDAGHSPDLSQHTPGVTVSPPSGNNTNKHGKQVTFTIVLDSQPTADVTLQLLTDKPNVATVAPAQLVFTATTWSAPQTVTVSGVQDNRIDGPQSFTVVLSRTFSDDSAYDGIDPVDFTLVNLDDDVAGLTVTSKGTLTTSETGASATFAVQLTTQPTAPVTVSALSSSTVYGTAAPAQLLFTPTTWNVPQTVTVTGAISHVADGDHDYAVTLSVSATDDVNYKVMAPVSVPIHDVDGNVAGIAVAVYPASGIVTHQSDGSYGNFISLTLTSQPTATVYFPISSSDTVSGGTVSPSYISFTPSNWQSSQYVYVTGANDHTVGPNRAYTIVIGAAQSSDPGYNGRDPADLPATNVNTSSVGILVTPTTGLVTTEVGGTTTFSVTLQSKPSAAVTLPVASSNVAEGTLTVASVVIQPADWATAHTVTVQGVADNLADGDQSYVVHVGASSSNDTAYQSLPGTDVSLTNLDSSAHFLTTQQLTTGATSQFVESATPDFHSASFQQGYALYLLDIASDKQTLVNPTTAGKVPTSSITGGGISADGRYVAFSSTGTDQVAGDTNGYEDIFIRDLQSSTTTRISLGLNGVQTNGGSTTPQISADGNYVAYSSSASNLVDGDTNGCGDIFLWSRATGLTTRVSVGSNATQANGSSFGPNLSSDGSRVIFSSAASNLVDGDTNQYEDAFVFDRTTGLTTRVDVSSTGAQTTWGISSGSLSLSADGRFALFAADSAVLGGGSSSAATLFVHDLQSGTTLTASAGEDGKPLASACIYSSISPNGRYVAFTASGSSGNAVYVYDLQLGKAKRVYGNWGYLCSPIPANDDTEVLFTGSLLNSSYWNIYLGISQ